MPCDKVLAIVIKISFIKAIFYLVNIIPCDKVSSIANKDADKEITPFDKLFGK